MSIPRSGEGSDRPSLKKRHKEIVSRDRFVELVNEEVIRHPKYKDGTRVLEINTARACGFEFYVDPAANRKEQETVIIEARGFIGERYDFEK